MAASIPPAPPVMRERRRTPPLAIGLAAVVLAVLVGTLIFTETARRSAVAARNDAQAELRGAKLFKSSSEDELAQLRGEVEQLRDENADLSSQVKKLEGENETLSRGRWKIKAYGQYEECVGAIIAAYNSSSFASQFTSAFENVAHSPACSSVFSFTSR